MKKLPPPESQIQEVLFELLTRFFIDRRSMMLSLNIWNLTARISNLRSKGVNIITNKVKSTNKYGREIEFAQYQLKDKANAIKIYLELKKNQSKPLK